MKRYAMYCTHDSTKPEWLGETLQFETNERGAAIARAYQHEAEQCAVRVHDRHTGQDIEL